MISVNLSIHSIWSTYYYSSLNSKLVGILGIMGISGLNTFDVIFSCFFGFIYGYSYFILFYKIINILNIKSMFSSNYLTYRHSLILMSIK